jgi:putative membrane-bound dehydrogenase-like protein
MATFTIPQTCRRALSVLQFRAPTMDFMKTSPLILLFSLLALGRAAAEPPAATLPDGFTLEVAAAAPLVRHPIMGCIDDRGRLYIGDAAGLNLKKDELEKQLPNRILQLADTKGDGHYDKVTVFADKMTFPQGGCWLNGSLYVASPPGIWKLTDTKGDGVADQREMIVGGFDYTGNAADVHGPFLHPNGRLYWCHGRKGHRVVQKDRASGRAIPMAPTSSGTR